MVRTLALLSVVLGACGSEATATPRVPTGGPPASTVTPPLVSHAALVIHDKLVATDGTVIKKLDGVSDGEKVIPDGPHRFRGRGVLIDAETGVVAKTFPLATIEDVRDHDYRLVRYESDGRRRWAAPFSGVRSVRPPDIAVGGGRAIAATAEGDYAFDDTTGRLVWHSDGGDRLAIAGDTVYSVHCNEPTNDRWLIGRALADGKERFRADIGLGCDPVVAATASHVIVTDEHHKATFVFDLAGKLILRLPEVALGHSATGWGGSFAVGDGTILVTDKHILRFDARGAVTWKRDTLRDTFVGEDDFAILPNGDILIANYGAISDSGADVIRLRAGDGTQVWRTRVDGLGVGHSEYEHLVYLDVRGDDVYVVSQGSYGGLFEKLSVATGSHELRCVIGNPCTPRAKP